MKKILRLIGINLLVLGILGALLFAGAEIYLRAKNVYQARSTTAVGLPLYQKSEALTWEHKPEVTIPNYPAGSGEALSLNCRGERGEECREPSALEKIIMLGDSFTFGINVKQSAIFPVLLDEKLGINTEVRNQGTIGYTLDQYAAYLNETVLNNKDFKPDAVVLNIFVGNDITELRRHKVLEEKNDLPSQVYDEEVFVGDDGSLRSRTDVLPTSFAWYKFKQALASLALQTGAEKITKPTLTWPVFLAENNPAQDQNLEMYWRTAESVLTRMNEELTKRGIKFLVVMVPMDVQVSRSYWNKYPGMPFGDDDFAARRPQTRLAALLQKQEVRFVDLLSEFTQDPRSDQLYFAQKDSHFTEYGHKRVSEILEPIVREILSNE